MQMMGLYLDLVILDHKVIIAIRKWLASVQKSGHQTGVKDSF